MTELGVGRQRQPTTPWRTAIMQARIENPALTVPGAMPALQKLGAVIKTGSLTRQPKP